MDAGGWATLVGDVLAAAAIVVAVITLQHAAATAKQARNDLREDRRIDFEQQVILTVATDYEDLARGGPVTPEMIAAKVRVLPANTLPLMRAFLRLPAPPVDVQRLRELAAEKGAHLETAGITWGDAGYFRDELQAEINEALDRLTEQRP